MRPNKRGDWPGRSLPTPRAWINYESSASRATLSYTQDYTKDIDASAGQRTVQGAAEVCSDTQHTLLINALADETVGTVVRSLEQ